MTNTALFIHTLLSVTCGATIALLAILTYTHTRK